MVSEISLMLMPSRTMWRPFSPDPALLQIEDIARGLALRCRFGGHLPCFYSVAQHSVLVSELVAPGFELAGLLHDAAEALSGVGDVLGPVKKHPEIAAAVGAIERRIDAAVAARFGLVGDFASAPEVNAADKLALRVEDRDLRLIPTLESLFTDPIVPLAWQNAERAFLARFYELTRAAS